MPRNDFLAFAAQSGANVISQDDYQALAALMTGFSAGTAKSAEVNKVLRQSTIMAAVLGQFIALVGKSDVIDDGNITPVLNGLLAGMSNLVRSVGVASSGSTVITGSTALTTTISGGLVVGNSTSAYVATLPSAATLAIGARVRLENRNAGMMTVTRASTDTFDLAGTLVTSIALGAGDTLELETNQINGWYVVGGTPLISTGASFISRTSGVVGASRNASMNIATAGVAGTFTADELIVETALGGARFCLANVSDTFNLTTDMDTGSPPASGYVALYKLFNPTTGASVRRIVNATAITAPEIYAGATPPAGFTASALVAVLPTNASGQFIGGTILVGRWVNRPALSALYSNVVQNSFTPLSIASVPRNARRAKILWGTTCTAVGTTQTLDLAADVNGSGQQSCASTTSVSGNGTNASGIVEIITPQTLIYRALNTPNNGTPTYSFYITGYEF